MRTLASYIDTSSKDGGFTGHISPLTAQRMRAFCKATNINCTQFIEESVKEKLDRVEEEMYHNLSKEDLIVELLRLKGLAAGRGENA